MIKGVTPVTGVTQQVRELPLLPFYTPDPHLTARRGQRRRQT